MDAAAVFSLRSALLRERLKWVGCALAPPTQGTRLSASQLAFKHELKRLGKELDAGLNVEASGYGWKALQAQENGLQRFFAEALAYMHAVGATPVDEAVGLVANSLVTELAERFDCGAGPMLIADLAETYSDYVPFIRMRFPAPNIWELPAVAHEFGHWAAYRATTGGGTYERPRPVASFIEAHVAPWQEKLRQEASGRQPLPPGEKEKIEQEIRRRKNWLNELFADMFATYVLGYAYAAYALLLRFDLARLYRQEVEHPPFADRADAILFMLKAVERELDGDRDERDRVKFRRNSLFEAWSAVVETAGPGPAEARFEFDKDGLATTVASVAANVRFHSGRAEDETRDVLRGAPPGQTPLLARDLLHAAWISLEDNRNWRGGADPVEIASQASRAWRIHSNPVKV